MKCKVDKSSISGEITCPQNKSYTHRAIFMASLAGNNSKVENVLLSSDTIATIEACKKIWCRVRRTKFVSICQKFDKNSIER